MKYDFFNSSKHSMGRSALLLSGGGIMGGYHLGFIKQLYEHDMLPRIISGSSAGSIIASFICTRSYAEIGDVILF
jgi:TAG lipase/steryl ester hydrolase/phospholipase A2/LPA acyltransferase